MNSVRAQNKICADVHQFQLECGRFCLLLGSFQGFITYRPIDQTSCLYRSNSLFDIHNSRVKKEGGGKRS